MNEEMVTALVGYSNEAKALTAALMDVLEERGVMSGSDQDLVFARAKKFLGLPADDEPPKPSPTETGGATVVRFPGLQERLRRRRKTRDEDDET